MRYLVPLLLLLSTSAHAVEISWTNPTEYEDGTVLELMEFQRFDLSCSATPGDRSVITDTWIDITPNRNVTNDFFPRGVPVHCALRVAVVHPVKTQGQITESVWSNEVTFTVPFSQPLPPTDLTVVTVDGS